MTTAYLGLGSNMGDRRENIKRALGELSKSGIKINRLSTLIETTPIGGPPQANFLNGAAEITTTLSAPALLKKLKKVENSFNRVKTLRNGPRPIDLDILLYGNSKITTPTLRIPHPQIRTREFVKIPLQEIARSAFRPPRL